MFSVETKQHHSLVAQTRSTTNYYGQKSWCHLTKRGQKPHDSSRSTMVKHGFWPCFVKCATWFDHGQISPGWFTRTLHLLASLAFWCSNVTDVATSPIFHINKVFNQHIVFVSVHIWKASGHLMRGTRTDSKVHTYVKMACHTLRACTFPILFHSLQCISSIKYESNTGVYQLSTQCYIDGGSVWTLDMI